MRESVNASRSSSPTCRRASALAARSGGGNWYVGTREGGRVRIRLPVAFGAQAVEVMVAGRDGAVSRARVQVTGVRQPTEGEITLPPVGGQGMLWPAAHPTLALDLFRGVDGLLVPAAPQALEDWLRRREEAVRAVQAQAAATPVATPAAAPAVPAAPVPQGPIPPAATAPAAPTAPAEPQAPHDADVAGTQGSDEPDIDALIRRLDAALGADGHLL